MPANIGQTNRPSGGEILPSRVFFSLPVFGLDAGTFFICGGRLYGKIFEQIFSSSIMEEELEVRYLFMSMLAICETGGVVDITPEALARKVNLPVDRVRLALQALQRPDPKSRSSNDEGRRLVAIDTHRDWGWIIVNYEKYKAIRSNEERREYMKEYMRRKRTNKLLTPVNSVNRLLTPLAKAEAEAEEEEKKPCPPKAVDDLGFPQFWSGYPRKEARKDALKAWMKLSPSLTLRVKIFEGLRKAKILPQWTKDEGQFIPLPASWIRAARWEDEPIELIQPKTTAELVNEIRRKKNGTGNGR